MLTLINTDNVFFTVEDDDHFSSSDALDSSDSHEHSASKLSWVGELVSMVTRKNLALAKCTMFEKHKKQFQNKLTT